MGEMFGAPEGQSQAMADIRANQLAQMSLDQGSVALESATLNLQSQKQMLSMMSQGAQQPDGEQSPGASTPQSYDMASTMDRFSVMAAASGLPEKAKEYATAASTLRNQASEIAERQSKQRLSDLTMIGSLMEGVTDDQTWKQANAMFQMQTGHPTPYAKLPYNPRVVEELRMGVMSAKDRALTDAAKARKEAAEASVSERKARVPLIRAQTALAAERTAKLKKTGAVQIIPKAENVRAITDLMVKDYGAGAQPEEMRVLARPVAERMQAIMRESSLTQSQAANRAYQEAKSQGAFGGFRPRPVMSGTPEKPLDLPEDYSKLKPNMFYKGKGAYANKVLLWTGSSFKPVGDVGVAGSPTEEEDVVDDEEDDEVSSNPDDEIPAE